METKFYSHLWRVVVCISPSAICQTGQLLLSHAHGVVDSAYTTKKKKYGKIDPKNNDVKKLKTYRGIHKIINNYFSSPNGL